MQRPQVTFQTKIVVFSLLLFAAGAGVASAQSAAVTGVVRDAHGVAQLGAMVQVVANDSALVGTAFTDLHGRYLVAHLSPGSYQVKASAALFLPAMRANLQLRSGAQAVVNLTLNTLFEPAAWLPAERRGADEPSDDWKWTLRSAANRPILRLVEDGDVIMVSSSAPETPRLPDRLRAEVRAGGSGFGDGGVHNVLVLDRVLDDGAGLTLHADFGTQPEAASTGKPPTRPSMEIATGFGTQLGLAGAARTVITYQSHPELGASNGAGTSGLQAMQMASAQQMHIGDFADVEAGGTVYMVRTSGYAVASRPFLKVTTHPGEAWTLGYRMATSQNLQSFAGLDSVRQQLPVAVMYRGRMQTEGGMHQEFAVGRKLGKGMVQVSYYRDSLGHVQVSGGGAPSSADLVQQAQPDVNGVPGNGVIADSTTGSFRFLSAGYKTSGLSMTLSEPLTSDIWMALEYATGAGLSLQDGTPMTLAGVTSGLAPQTAQTATLAVRGRVVRSGTKIRAAYRWQPSRIVTAVDPYAPFSDEAYLSCYLRQALRLGKMLPPGLDATVEVSNLLAQGYRPFLSADGQTLFLAQTPRTLQAGLAFTF
ncbi:MAG: carboxypeptidase-like regulatory domain-containing protein [Acidobacteriota bacterium]|nr:carboxypeptidase-like regulatory domain-containing protein [Acidobacteriota bacterium]